MWYAVHIEGQQQFVTSCNWVISHLTILLYVFLTFPEIKIIWYFSDMQVGPKNALIIEHTSE